MEQKIMGLGESDSATDPLTSIDDIQEAECLLRLKEALTDLHELLEQYTPTWYTQAHRDKAKLALSLFNRRDLQKLSK